MMKNDVLNGVNAYGVKTPLIQIGDDLKEIVYDSVMKRTGGKLPSKSIIAVTEAVVAMAQKNIVPADTVAKEISKMYKEQTQLGYSKMLPQIAMGHS